MCELMAVAGEGGVGESEYGVLALGSLFDTTVRRVTNKFAIAIDIVIVWNEWNDNMTLICCIIINIIWLWYKLILYTAC